MTLLLLLVWTGVCQGLQTVTVTPLRDLWLFPENDAPAEAISLNDSHIGAVVEARIRDIPVKVGELVAKDAILVELRPTKFELALRATKAQKKALNAQLVLAKAQLGRVATLRKTRSASEELVNQRQSEVNNLAARLDEQDALIARARQDLEDCSVRSPFRALVIDRLASVGEMAAPGTALIHVIDLDSIELKALVQATDIASLREAAEPMFIALGQRYPVRVNTVVARIDPQQRSQEVRLHFTSKAALPGATGRLTWRTDLPHLPPHLLVRRDDTLGVLLLSGDIVRFQPLPQAQEGRPAAIGLPPDTLIIIDGRFRVNDGDRVQSDPLR